MTLTPETPPQEPIRADLGRPETPQERADRKAQNSRNYRGSKTTNNLVIALVVSLAVVLATVLVVVRPEQSSVDAVDYVAVAADAQPGVDEPLADPPLPPGWSANRADLQRNTDESFTWYIGLLTPKDQFIALEQGINTNPGWFAGLLGSVKPTGTVTIDGVEWTIYDDRASNSTGNFAYSLGTTVGGSDYLLHGTAVDGEFDTLATVLAEDQFADTTTGTDEGN